MLGALSMLYATHNTAVAVVTTVAVMAMNE
jgi:hypothetical protein